MTRELINPCPNCNGWGQKVRKVRVNSEKTIKGIKCLKCDGTGKKNPSRVEHSYLIGEKHRTHICNKKCKLKIK